jgi:hypothetical protein
LRNSAGKQHDKHQESEFLHRGDPFDNRRRFNCFV